MDPKKVRAIIEWLEPRNLHEVCSFYGLTTFYKRFIHGFSMMMAPITDCIHNGYFHLTNTASKAFKEIKSRMINAPVTHLPDCTKVFKVACDDASKVELGRVLNQEGHPVAYFSEKLNEARQKYSAYNKEFYAVVQALRY